MRRPLLRLSLRQQITPARKSTTGILSDQSNRVATRTASSTWDRVHRRRTDDDNLTDRPGTEMTTLRSSALVAGPYRSSCCSCCSAYSGEPQMGVCRRVGIAVADNGRGDPAVTLGYPVASTGVDHEGDPGCLRDRPGHAAGCHRDGHPGFGFREHTAGCTSVITYINGEAGVLRYRGYPIGQLAEHSRWGSVQRSPLG
jgi:hypothetical protein